MLIEKYILDPLSVIVKLAILSKKPVGTKIAIWSNTIYIQEIGVFQSLVRILYKNTKDDVQYLYNPIELACKNYLTAYYIQTYPDIKNLFSNAIKGLDKLKETYSHNIIITHSLNLYTSLINNYLGDNFNSNLYTSDIITGEYKKEELHKIFSNTWVPNQIKTDEKKERKEERKEERIKAILNLIDFIDKDTEFNNSVKCLEEFMFIIDNETRTKIDAINYEHDTKELEKKNISQKQTNSIKSIVNTLTTNVNSNTNINNNIVNNVNMNTNNVNTNQKSNKSNTNK
jgi:hypothetical protein